MAPTVQTARISGISCARLMEVFAGTFVVVLAYLLRKEGLLIQLECEAGRLRRVTETRWAGLLREIDPLRVTTAKLFST